MTPLKLAFVTGNAGKAKTAREHLAPLGIEVEQSPTKKILCNRCRSG